MIKNNFDELVAQRKLKITRISNDTGLSRPTLNSLSRDDGKGIQYDTLNTLCKYFNITPCEFFDYLPFDLEYNIEQDTEEELVTNSEDGIEYRTRSDYILFINMKGKNQNKTFEIKIDVEKTYNLTDPIEGNLYEYLKFDINNIDIILVGNPEALSFIELVKGLSASWQTKIQLDILLFISTYFTKEDNLKNSTRSVTGQFDLSGYFEL